MPCKGKHKRMRSGMMERVKRKMRGSMPMGH